MGKAKTDTVDAPVPDDHPFMKAIPDGSSAEQAQVEEEDKSTPCMHR